MVILRNKCTAKCTKQKENLVNILNPMDYGTSIALCVEAQAVPVEGAADE
jgi:hypothetical protein